MRSQCLVLVGALTAVSALSFTPRSVAGQTASASTVFRTPWGEPDLQGLWERTVQIPLERPAEFAGKEFLTDEEVAELDKKRMTRGTGTAEDPGRDSRRDRGSDNDVNGAYDVVFNSVLKSGNRTSLIVDPPDGLIPPLTPEAKKRLDMERAYRAAPATAPNPGSYITGVMKRADGPEDRGIMERCLGVWLPNVDQGVNFGDDMSQIVQSPGYVAIYYEYGHQGGANVLIPVDGSPHLAPKIRQWLGDSRGHWEGDTLVVDTTNFTQKAEFRGSRENLHLIERFTRVDANTLRRRVTIEDPTVWTKPWTVVLDLTKADDKLNRIYESTCHEGNDGMTGILAGTRAEERAAQKRAKDGRK